MAATKVISFTWLFFTILAVLMQFSAASEHGQRNPVKRNTDETAICSDEDSNFDFLYEDKPPSTPSGCFEIDAGNITQENKIFVDFFGKEGPSSKELLCIGGGRIELLPNDINHISYSVDSQNITLKLNAEDTQFELKDGINMTDIKISSIKIRALQSLDIKIEKCKDEFSPGVSSQQTHIMIGIILACVIIVAIIGAAIMFLKKRKNRSI